jgi:hypothetical protein
MKKILVVLLILVSLSNVFATGVFDVKSTQEVYKFSDQGDINLPFIYSSAERLIMDKDLIKSGISMSSKNIDILNKLKGVQVLVSGDTVNVDNELEYGLIISPNVVINSSIDKMLVIISEKVNITSNSVLNDDIVIMSNEVVLSGNAKGNVLGSVQKFTLNSNIEKDLRLNLDSIVLGENSKISGDIYLETYNDIKLDNYKNATINKIDKITKESSISEMFLNNLQIALVFALVYLFLSKKTNLFKFMFNKLKYPIFTTISGFIILLTLPLVFIILLFLSVFGLYMLTIPFSIIYYGIILLSVLLSTFIVGSLMSEYISNKYTEVIKNNWYKLILSTIVFLVLKLIVEIPNFGFTLALCLCILSIGIVATLIFKKSKI